MALAFVAGLWAVVRIGSTLITPDDLRGQWMVQWDDSSPPAARAAGMMRIAQSGRFFSVRIGDAPAMSLTLEPGWTGKKRGNRLRMKLRGEKWHMSLTGNISAEQPRVTESLRIELSGPSHHIGVATRIAGSTERAAAPPGSPGVADAH